MGGPGTNRSLQLVKYLPKSGYTPIVLTVTHEDVNAGPYPRDYSPLEGLGHIRVVRTKTREPRVLKKVLIRLNLIRLSRYVFYPIFWESCALWPFTSFRTARKLIREENIGLVYTTSGPFSSMLLGCLLKVVLGVRWVADLRDPFTDGYMWVWPSKPHWYVSRFIERVLLRVADHVIVNTPEVERLYLKRKLVERSKLTHVTNGYSL